MFKANIYSLEPLSTTDREAVRTGIEIVAAYMGETALSTELIVRTATNQDGRVDPRRANFAKLNHLVELHMMVMPLVASSHNTRLGVAGVGRGWGFVDPTTAPSALSLQSTTAHEVSHAFGFVNGGASQADPESRHHCTDPSCIMHMHQELTLIPESHRLRQKGMVAVTKRALKEFFRPEHPKDTHAQSQYDFCLACKMDLRHHGPAKIGQLRTDRLVPNARIK